MSDLATHRQHKDLWTKSDVRSLFVHKAAIDNHLLPMIVC